MKWKKEDGKYANELVYEEVKKEGSHVELGNKETYKRTDIYLCFMFIYLFLCENQVLMDFVLRILMLMHGIFYLCF